MFDRKDNVMDANLLMTLNRKHSSGQGTHTLIARAWGKINYKNTAN